VNSSKLADVEVTSAKVANMEDGLVVRACLENFGALQKKRI
jgi:hypothetical protein